MVSLLELPHAVIELLLSQVGSDVRVICAGTCTTLAKMVQDPAVWTDMHIRNPAHPSIAAKVRQAAATLRHLSVGPSPVADILALLNACVPMYGLRSLFLSVTGSTISESFFGWVPGFPHLASLAVDFEGGTSMRTLELPALPLCRDLTIIQNMPRTLSYRTDQQPFPNLQALTITGRRCDILASQCPVLERLEMRLDRESYRRVAFPSEGRMAKVDVTITHMSQLSRIMRALGRRRGVLKMLTLRCQCDIRIQTPFVGMRHVRLVALGPARYLEFDYQQFESVGSSTLETLQIEGDALMTVRFYGVRHIRHFMEFWKHRKLHISPQAWLELDPID